MFRGVAAEIAELIGEATTLRLLRARGGTVIFLPVRAKGDVISDLIGEDACAALIDYFGAGRLALPIGPGRGAGARRAQGINMFRDGRSITDVARACEVDARTASRWRAESQTGSDARPVDRDQLQLPFDTGSPDHAG